jgi:hypothetical protein
MTEQPRGKHHRPEPLPRDLAAGVDPDAIPPNRIGEPDPDDAANADERELGGEA